MHACMFHILLTVNKFCTKMRLEEKEVEKKKKNGETVSFYKLLGFADGLDWTLMALGGIGAVIHGMAQPIGYLLLGKALNAFGDNINDTQAMVKAIYKIVPFVWYMAIATFPAGILEVGCWMYASERQSFRFRLAFLRSVLSQDVQAFDTDFTPPIIINGIGTHINLIQDAIGEKLGHFLSCLATFFSGILIAAICCWEVALLTFLVVPLIFLIGAAYTKRMNSISSMRMLYQSEATSLVEQTISQIKTVYAFVGEARSTKLFSEYMEKQLFLGKGEALIKGIGTGMFQTVTFCSWALIVWVGAVIVVAGRATGGDIIAAVMSILFGAISLTYAAPDLQVFNQAKVAGYEVFRVIQRKPVINYNAEGKTIIEAIHGEISINEVHFVYPSRPEKAILAGFSLSIPAGKTVALVGRSGSGKSTLISLVSRFYDPFKGEILIDKLNIKDLNLKFLRQNIGTVSQEPYLFAGSIKDNIKVGYLLAIDQQIEKAAEMANAHTFISQLPNQYSTEVGERGLQLSGGQKQRIAISRALLKNPPILLLDEATSALDSESESLVQDALEKAMKGRTVIVIAHRISTIINADIIAVVENGKVAETGTHQSLLASSNFYSNLFNIQNLKPVHSSSSSLESQTIQHKIMSEDFDSVEEHKETKKTEESEKKAMFLRIWFGLSKRDVLKTIAGSFAAGLSGISKPIFGFFIITIGVTYYEPNSVRKVGWYSLAFSLIGFFTLCTLTLQHYFFGVVGEKAMKCFRGALYTAVLQNEVGWFEKSENKTAFLTSHIMNDTSMVKLVIGDRMAVIVQCISSILIATIVSIIVNWRMALVAWAVMPCHFIGGLIQAKSAQGFAGYSSSAYSKLVSLASESATNIRTVASFCHEDELIKKAIVLLENPKRRRKIESLKYGLIQGFSLCLWNIAHAVALWYTAILIHRNQASFKDGIRSYQIFSLTVPSITELWTLIPTVVAAISILRPSFQILDRKTEIDPNTPPVSEFCNISGKVEFYKVRFNYPSRPEVAVLSNFSLVIESGSRIALVGPSGAGKSSILALLLRFYDPKQGRILIDDKDIKEYNLRNLRARVGFVQQEPLLFSGSIRDNICYGNDEASEGEIMYVSREANIHEFIGSLPEGYNTVVGEKGCQLSGGQKQRIAIARTLLKKPAILLLDEATSALDSESEQSVVKALRGRRTEIVVAHRLSTVINSDAIVVMDRGEIVEMGSHSSLMEARDGVYSKLLKLQSFNDF